LEIASTRGDTIRRRIGGEKKGAFDRIDQHYLVRFTKDGEKKNRGSKLGLGSLFKLSWNKKRGGQRSSVGGREKKQRRKGSEKRSSHNLQIEEGKEGGREQNKRDHR